MALELLRVMKQEHLQQARVGTDSRVHSVDGQNPRPAPVGRFVPVFMAQVFVHPQDSCLVSLVETRVWFLLFSSARYCSKRTRAR